jgi:hypothetical protein
VGRYERVLGVRLTRKSIAGCSGRHGDDLRRCRTWYAALCSTSWQIAGMRTCCPEGDLCPQKTRRFSNSSLALPRS